MSAGSQWRHHAGDIERGAVPMIVTARLSEPIVYTLDCMHLDGLLAAAYVRDLSARDRRRLPPVQHEEWASDFRLPLARWYVGLDGDVDPHTRRLCHRKWAGGHSGATPRLWGWCASSEDAQWLHHGVAEVRKSQPASQMAQWTSAKTVNQSAGALKAYDLRLPTVLAHSVRWYALGWPDEVERLLRTHVTAIGRKRGLGWGRVSRWTVERTDQDWSVVKDGRLMRRMPEQAGEHGRRSLAGIRPPYWHQSRLLPCVDPPWSDDADAE